MRYMNVAVSIVLAAVQAPRPAAIPTTVASEDETLCGVSAMSVSVQNKAEGTGACERRRT